MNFNRAQVLKLLFTGVVAGTLAFTPSFLQQEATSTSFAKSETTTNQLEALPRAEVAPDPEPEAEAVTLQMHAQAIYDAAGLSEKGLEYDLFQKALTGFYNMKAAGVLKKDILTVVDFRKHSREKRLWVVDVAQQELIYHNLVAHGSGSGNEFARKFSNRPQSHMSSLGFYRVAETYHGKHGLSLRLDGYDRGYNDKARNRAVVIHSADYANPGFVKRIGRLGRSWGCPALPQAGYEEVVKTIATGSCLFLYYPDQGYLTSSKWLKEETASQYFATAMAK